ncbi:TIR domain-containing protein [Bradyrhizobium sp. DASA03076]|uniref:TIR domain-containing protein n=1 Tax=Bradyrhizobium sp. BLXBL-03 TaxID=3395916 RepID=UPI003F70F7FA
MPIKPYLFVSYAREDLALVRPLVDAVREELDFRSLPIQLWMDIADLKPGEEWNASISEALTAAIGFLFFLSPRSLRSDWVRREIEIAARVPGRLIIPVILHEPLPLPPALASRQWLRFVGRPSKKDTIRAATEIAEAAERYLHASPTPSPVVSKAEAPIIAARLASDVRSSAEGQTPQGSPKTVFVVHGHDLEPLTQLEDFLGSVSVEAIVLSRRDESPQSLFQKFMTVAGRARFAIVLLGADDYGASRRQYDTSGVGDRALQFRARQNVLLELGFFYGRLGWENVFVVYKHPDAVFPNFERPSDLDGVVFDTFEDPKWQIKLQARLSAAGFELK